MSPQPPESDPIYKYFTEGREGAGWEGEEGVEKTLESPPDDCSDCNWRDIMLPVMRYLMRRGYGNKIPWDGLQKLTPEMVNRLVLDPVKTEASMDLIMIGMRGSRRGAKKLSRKKKPSRKKSNKSKKSKKAKKAKKRKTKRRRR